MATGPTNRCPNEGYIGTGVDNGERTGFLLLRLAARARHPAQNDAVYGVGANSKDAHGEVFCTEIEGRAA